MAKVIIKEEVYDKIMFWVEQCPDEVSGFGKVITLPNGDFMVTEAYLIDQDVGAAHTDIDGQALAKLMYETRNEPGDLRYWFHSHVNMQVFWSGTDTATIKQLGGNGWIIATVFNKRHEHRTTICYKTEVTTPWGKRNDLQLDDEQVLEIESVRYNEETIAAWKSQLATKVKKKAYVSPSLGKQWETTASYTQPLLESQNVPANTYEDVMEWGAYGYGLKVEAEAVGVTEKRYEKWLMDDSPHPSREWLKLEEKATLAWRDGTMDKVMNKYNNRGGAV